MLLVALCSMTLTVATRYWFSSDPPADGSSSVKGRLVSTKVQRLALGKDVVQWIPGVERFSLVPEPTADPGVVPADPSPTVFHLDEAISDRAPPLAPLFA